MYTRTGGESGCPLLRRQAPWPGFNDLAARFPHLAQEWHPEKNGRLTPGTWCPAAGGRSGGSAPRATCGEAAIASPGAVDGAGSPGVRRKAGGGRGE